MSHVTNARRSDPREDAQLVAARCEGTVDLAVDVGILVAHSPRSDAEQFQSFGTQAATDAVDELALATDGSWQFYFEGPVRRWDLARRRPAEFLDRATHQMVEGP